LDVNGVSALAVALGFGLAGCANVWGFGDLRLADGGGDARSNADAGDDEGVAGDDGDARDATDAAGSCAVAESQNAGFTPMFSVDSLPHAWKYVPKTSFTLRAISFFDSGANGSRAVALLDSSNDQPAGVLATGGAQVASGWNVATLDAPVPISGAHVYFIAAYFLPISSGSGCTTSPTYHAYTLDAGASAWTFEANECWGVRECE
jgi:hypothetical protein